MRFVFAFIISTLSLSLHAQDLNEYKKEIFTGKDQYLPYRILFPLAFDTSKKYPLLVFCMALMKREMITKHNWTLAVVTFWRILIARNFPAVIVFPQCPSNDVWAYFDAEFDSAGVLKRAIFPFRKEPTTVTSLLKQLVDSLMILPFIDVSKIYIGGLSQGGMGVFDMVARYPNIFTAAFPICGAGKVSTADKFAKQTALWIFHGSDDDVVPVHFSRQFYQKLKSLAPMFDIPNTRV